MNEKISPAQTPVNVEASDTKSLRSTLALRIPACPLTLRRVRALAGDRHVRIETVARYTARDPVLTLELLRAANSMFFSQGRPPATTPRTAILRLGSSHLLETIDRIQEHSPIADQEIADCLEKLRLRCKRTSALAKHIATTLRNDRIQEAQVLGLFIEFGELLACLHLGKEYLKLTREKSPAIAHYRMLAEHSFDVRLVLLTNLRQSGIPENLISPLNREATLKTPEWLSLRYIVESSAELLGAFETNKWDKYALDKELPPTSSLRLLQLTKRQYTEIFQFADEYLRLPADHAEEEDESDEFEEEFQDEFEDEEEEIEEEIDDIDTEIHLILDKTVRSEPNVESKSDQLPKQETVTPEQPANDQMKTPGTHSVAHPGRPAANSDSIDQEISGLLVNNIDPAMQESAAHSLLRFYADSSRKLIGEFQTLCLQLSDTCNILELAVEKLTAQGLFHRAALLALSPDKHSATIVVAKGEGLEQGRTIPLNDPLSPLFAETTIVKSFSTSSTALTIGPLGSSSYAVSPIKGGNSNYLLYADCGTGTSMTFEARRIFRFIAESLNGQHPQ